MTWECPFSGPFSGQFERILLAYENEVDATWQRGVEEERVTHHQPREATLVWRPVGLNSAAPLRGDTVRAAMMTASKPWLVHPEVPLHGVPGFRPCNVVCCLWPVDFPVDETCTFHGGAFPPSGRPVGGNMGATHAAMRGWRCGWEKEQLLVGTFPHGDHGDIGILYVPQRPVLTRAVQNRGKITGAAVSLGPRHGLGSAMRDTSSSSTVVRAYGDYRLVRCCWLAAPPPPTDHQQTANPCVFEVKLDSLSPRTVERDMSTISMVETAVVNCMSNALGAQCHLELADSLSPEPFARVPLDVANGVRNVRTLPAPLDEDLLHLHHRVGPFPGPYAAQRPSQTPTTFTVSTTATVEAVRGATFVPFEVTIDATVVRCQLSLAQIRTEEQPTGSTQRPRRRSRSRSRSPSSRCSASSDSDGEDPLAMAGSAHHAPSRTAARPRPRKRHAPTPRTRELPPPAQFYAINPFEELGAQQGRAALEECVAFAHLRDFREFCRHKQSYSQRAFVCNARAAGSRPTRSRL
eukprot:COSAG06_NODE_1678_length_8739_cov_3.134144_4_plen_521_part_00